MNRRFMGTVFINGKEYDSVTGLAKSDNLSVSDEINHYIEKPILAKNSNANQVRKTKKRLSKQERLAAEIAQEFSEEKNLANSKESEKTAENNQPAWLNQFTDLHNSKKETEEKVASPSWISNYVRGGAPTEIEPIGLEKAARQQALNKANVEAELNYSRETAANTHRKAQRSVTLNRQFVQKPESNPIITRNTAKVATKVETHPLVHKFGNFAVPVQQKTSPKPVIATKTIEPEKPFRASLTQSQENQLTREKTAPRRTTSRELKDVLIREQMEAPIDNKLSRKDRKRAEKLARRAQRQNKRHFRATSLMTAALAVALMGGFVTYTQMPNISVRVAAMRAGVDAKSPYTPSGYSIDGPVAYTHGTVTINYKNNGGGKGYSLTQSNSDWNDDIIRDDIIEPMNSNYETLKGEESVVYRYDNKATWINNGTLYTLSVNDSLGDNQILDIANSI